MAAAANIGSSPIGSVIDLRKEIQRLKDQLKQIEEEGPIAEPGLTLEIRKAGGDSSYPSSSTLYARIMNNRTRETVESLGAAPSQAIDEAAASFKRRSLTNHINTAINRLEYALKCQYYRNYYGSDPSKNKAR